MRLMGATIGEDVWFAADPPLELDCLHIGDRTIIDESVEIIPHTMDYGMAQFADIRIGKDCMVNDACLLMPATTLGDGVELLAGTVACKNEYFPPFTKYGGNFSKFICHRYPMRSTEPSIQEPTRAQPAGSIFPCLLCCGTGNFCCYACPLGCVQIGREEGSEDGVERKRLIDSSSSATLNYSAIGSDANV